MRIHPVCVVFLMLFVSACGHAGNEISPLTVPRFTQEGEKMLRLVRSAVLERLSDGFSEAEIDEVVDVYSICYPNRPAVAGVPNLMHENVRAVARELETEMTK